jgi:hypothetical protein
VNRYLAINIEGNIGQPTVNMRQATCLGKMNGTAVTNRLQNSFKITCTDHRIIEILGLRPSNRLPGIGNFSLKYISFAFLNYQLIFF